MTTGSAKGQTQFAHLAAALLALAVEPLLLTLAAFLGATRCNGANMGNQALPLTTSISLTKTSKPCYRKGTTSSPPN